MKMISTLNICEMDKIPSIENLLQFLFWKSVSSFSIMFLNSQFHPFEWIYIRISMSNRQIRRRRRWEAERREQEHQKATAERRRRR